MVWQSVIKFFKAVGAFLANPYTQAVLTAYTVYTGVKNYQQARDMLAKGAEIMANKTSAGGKIPVIYGTRRVGAQVIYMDTKNNRSKDLFVVYALCVGEVEEIMGHTIEIDGNSILDGNIYKGGGYVGSDKSIPSAANLNTASQVGDVQYSQAGRLGTDPTLRYSFVFNLHHGSASQTADPMLTASIPEAWTSNHKLNGIAYIAAAFDYDKKGMYRGVPQITVQVRGKKVYDPRSESTIFSSNPALCFLDYIQNDEYGKGLATADINMSTFEDAADICDVFYNNPFYGGSYQNVTWSAEADTNIVTVDDFDDAFQNKVDEKISIKDSSDNLIVDGVKIEAFNSYQFYSESQVNEITIDDTILDDYTDENGVILAVVQRFHCNGYVDTNKNVMDNAKELLANMRGIFTYIDGKYELKIEDTGSSTFSITDDHIIADTGISVDYGNKDKKANKVIVEFFNANKKYELDTVTELHDATPNYYSDDGEILEIKAEFPYITDPYIASNMAKAILGRSRNQTTVQFLGTPEIYKLNVGDIVDLTYAGLGFSSKLFRIEALELQPDGLVSVSMIEYLDIYSWLVPLQEATADPTTPPTAGALAAPENVTFTDTDASAINRPFISWDNPTDFPVKEFRLDVTDSSDNPVFSKIVDTNQADLSFIAKGSDYNYSVTAFNGLGIESNATTGTFTIADDPVKTTEVEIDGVTLSTVESYGTTTGKTGNYVKFTNQVVMEDEFLCKDFAEFTGSGGVLIDGGDLTISGAGLSAQGRINADGGLKISSGAPASATSTGTAGQIQWDSNYIYVCVATNTWKRVAISTW